jgi:hypothetical protein
MAEKSDVTVTRIGDKPVTDIDALIQQYGGQSAEQPAAAQPGQLDMMALIRQYGGQVDQQDQIPQREGLDALSQYAGVINRAIAPYATVGIGGTAVGGPIAGAGAVGTLALTDLGATLANLGLQAAGSERRVPVPSDVIRGGYEAVMPGVFREPETTGQRYTASGAEAAASALSQANALRQLAQTYGPGVVKNVLSTMGRDRAAQTAAATGGAAAQQTMIETSEPGSIQQNPLLVAAAGVLGSMATGRLAARGPQTVKEMLGKGTPSEEQLYKQAKAKYNELDNSGVVFSGSAYDRLLSSLKNRLADAGYKETTAESAITAVINKMNKFAGKNQTWSELDRIRSDIGKSLIKSGDENVRRLGREMADEIDEFVDNASPRDLVITVGPGGVAKTGDVKKLLAARDEGRRLWGQVSRSEEMSELFRQAKLEAGATDTSLDQAIRNKFLSLAKAQGGRKLKRFSPEEQEFILNVSQGGEFTKLLTEFSDALKFNRGLGGGLYLGVGGLATPYAAQLGQIDPLTAVVLGTGIAGVRGVTGAFANRLATSRAETAARAMRGFRPQPVTSIGLPAVQTAVSPNVNFLTQSEVLNALSGR